MPSVMLMEMNTFLGGIHCRGPTDSCQKVTALIKARACWDICCKWKDGSTLWEKLSNLKDSHPIQVAQYVIAQGIQYEPAFNWWVYHVVKKRDRIIFMVRWCSLPYLKKIHKFVLSCLRLLKRLMPLTRKWKHSLVRCHTERNGECMKITFQTIPEGEKPPNGFQYVNCHMV